jgi:hypothetical protein
MQPKYTSSIEASCFYLRGSSRINCHFKMKETGCGRRDVGDVGSKTT